LNDEHIEGIIRDFIRQNPQSTIRQVANHLTKMKILSYVTARDKVFSLIDKGIIVDRKEGNSFHRLFINDYNSFNIIDNQLREFESVLDDFDKVIATSESSEIETLTTSEIQDSFKDLDFTKTRNQYFLLMLRLLLLETTDRIKSPKHGQVVYNRIIKLMIRLDNNLTRGSRSVYKFLIDRDLDVIEKRFKSHLEKKGIDAISINNLRRVSENFKHNFLD